MKKILFISLAVVLALSMGLIGCEGEEGEGEGEGERTTGPYLDEVLIVEESDFAQAIVRLQNDDLDVFAYGLADADLLTTVEGDPSLNYTTSLGSFNELTLNPVGPVFNARFPSRTAQVTSTSMHCLSDLILSSGFLLFMWYAELKPRTPPPMMRTSHSMH